MRRTNSGSSRRRERSSAPLGGGLLPLIVAVSIGAVLDNGGWAGRGFTPSPPSPVLGMLVAAGPDTRDHQSGLLRPGELDSVEKITATGADASAARWRVNEPGAQHENAYPGPATAPTATVSADAFTANSGNAPSTPYSMLQMNLCLSGMAECFDDTQYPTVVEEAINAIRARKPSAASFNEACSGDMHRISQQTGYHMRFAPVLVHGQRLPCVDPAGRGVFGNAVITKAAIDSSAHRAFAAQVDGEETRGWICVVTVRDVSVCTTHLSTRGSDAARAANASQCAELAALVASRDAHGPVLVAGDINHQRDCAPAGTWTMTDWQAPELPGIQHSYGSAEEFRVAHVQILPATYTDHEFMLTTTTLVTRVALPSRPDWYSDDGPALRQAPRLSPVGR
jgi:hypothetical protein